MQAVKLRPEEAPGGPVRSDWLLLWRLLPRGLPSKGEAGRKQRSGVGAVWGLDKPESRSNMHDRAGRSAETSTFLREHSSRSLTFTGEGLWNVLPWWSGGCWGGAITRLGSSRVLPFSTVRREDQVQRGKLQHTLHPGHGQAAEADLRGLKTDRT